MRTIYKPSEYYKRALDSMMRTSQSTSEGNNFRILIGVTSLARLVLKLGVLDSERREFWRFFARTLTKHRDKFAASMRFAAMGYHFRKLNEAYGK